MELLGIALIVMLVVIVIATNKGKYSKKVGNEVQASIRKTEHIGFEENPTAKISIERYNNETKMQAIKTIRLSSMNIGLKEAKALVDDGGELEIYLAKTQLEDYYKQLTEAGVKFSIID